MNDIKQRALRALFDRYFSWRLEEMVAPRYPVVLDYPIAPRPRYGEGAPPHPELVRMLAQGDARYAAALAGLNPFRAALARIPDRQDGAEPGWDNGYFSGMDAIALYGLIAARRPARLLEVGSGNSTRFARRAIRDHGLDTRITSIDPAPRADIDLLCDEVVRAGFETADPALAGTLAPGDFLFIDNSHRVFQNSDATVFFLEWLPRLATGVIVHIHDIFLPYDYPGAWVKRHYSEQYLLATWLLGGAAGLEILLPVAYVDRHASLGAQCAAQWDQPPFSVGIARTRGLTGGYAGTSFWLRKT